MLCLLCATSPFANELVSPIFIVLSPHMKSISSEKHYQQSQVKHHGVSQKLESTTSNRVACSTQCDSVLLKFCDIDYFSSCATVVVSSVNERI